MRKREPIWPWTSCLKHYMLDSSGSKEKGPKHCAIFKQRNDILECKWSQKLFYWHFFSEKDFEKIVEREKNIKLNNVKKGEHNNTQQTVVRNGTSKTSH